MTKAELKAIRKYINQNCWRDKEEPFNVVHADLLIAFIKTLVNE